MLQRFKRFRGDITAAVKELRSRLGLSQQEFATALGISVRAVANYEAGRRPNLPMLGRISDYALSRKQYDIHRRIEQELESLVFKSARSITPLNEHEEALLRVVLCLARNSRLIPNWSEIAGGLLIEMGQLIESARAGAEVSPPLEELSTIRWRGRWAACPALSEFWGKIFAIQSKTAEPLKVIRERLKKEEPELAAACAKEREILIKAGLWDEDEFVDAGADTNDITGA